ncbi:MAG: sulfite exporter TauE/SafE family protein [Steroidobacteraceae bacterium]
MSDPMLYVAAGLFVGTMVGFTGVGGGSLMTPILVLLFGQSPVVAVGTDLMFSATTKLAATASFGYSRRVDWRIVGRLACGSIPGAVGVIFWFWLVRSTPDLQNRIIPQCLAVLLGLTAVGLLLQNLLQRLGLRITGTWLERAERYKLPLTVLTGLLVGAGVTLTSVGAGALGAVALLYLYPLRLTADRLVATDIAHALPVTFLAAVGHATLGHINLQILACLLLGSVPGVLLASRAVIRIPPMITRVMIAVMLAVVSERMLFR